MLLNIQENANGQLQIGINRYINKINGLRPDVHTAHALALATHFFCVCDAKFNKFCGLFSLVLVEFQWKNMVIYFC